MDQQNNEHRRQQALDKLLQARREHQANEWLFLDAWKRGVRLAGPEYFDLKGAQVDEATDKNHLRPRADVIEHAMGVLSGGQGVFLAAMCSFYNSRWGQSLLASLGEHRLNICNISAALDSEHREVIAELFRTYNGW